jgi:ankyrin repeat protein
VLEWAQRNGFDDVVNEFLEWQISHESPKEELMQLLLLHTIDLHCLPLFKLLLTDERFDPSVENQLSIRWACQKGHLDIVKLLLADKRVDPSAADNSSIRWACCTGPVEVVKLLLADKRTDPCADNQAALRFAIFNDGHDIVKLLLADQRVNLTGLSSPPSSLVSSLCSDVPFVVSSLNPSS